MFKLKIATDNAAFRDMARNDEVARILLTIINRMQDGYTEGRCLDINGNTVGDWSLT